MSLAKLLAGLSGGLLLAMAGATASRADDHHDHDAARQALAAGEILPLKKILERVEREHPGQIMEVELDRKGERWIYKIKVLQPGGTLKKLKVDGRSGETLADDERQRKSP